MQSQYVEMRHSGYTSGIRVSLEHRATVLGSYGGRPMRCRYLPTYSLTKARRRLTDMIVSPLVRELLVWVSERPRTYEETMQAWRSHCPRHPVWEDASVDGLVEVVDGPGGMAASRVVLTAKGSAVLLNSSAGG
jgi:hypothetical protein